MKYMSTERVYPWVPYIKMGGIRASRYKSYGPETTQNKGQNWDFLWGDDPFQVCVKNSFSYEIHQIKYKLIG